jgi:putative transposase
MKASEMERTEFSVRGPDLLPEISTQDNLESSVEKTEGSYQDEEAKFIDEQTLDVVKQLEVRRPAKDPARELGISDQTLYNWRAKYSGLDVNEARRLRALKEENRRLKALVADLSLDREALKAVIRKNSWSL